MAKAKKEGKPKKNRGNLVKRLKLISKNREILKKYENNSLKPRKLGFFVLFNIYKLLVIVWTLQDKNSIFIFNENFLRFMRVNLENIIIK